MPRLEQIRNEWRAWVVIEETVQAEINKIRQAMRLKFGSKTVNYASNAKDTLS